MSDVVGIISGLLAGQNALPLLTVEDFWLGARYYYRPFDGWYSVIKGFAFAWAITVIPCYVGLNTSHGAEGVGKSTTRAVVATSVVILFLDVAGGTPLRLELPHPRPARRGPEVVEQLVHLPTQFSERSPAAIEIRVRQIAHVFSSFFSFEIFLHSLREWFRLLSCQATYAVAETGEATS